MANLNRAQGFRPYGEVRQAICAVAGGTFYKGDCVKLNSAGKVVVCAAGDTIYGVALQYGTTNDRVMVSIHPEQLYVAQCHGSSVDVQDDIGNLADILATAGDTTYKVSRQEIDDSTLGTGSGGGFVIVDILQKPSNAGGTYAEAVCRINEHQVFGKDAFAGI